MKLYNNHYSAVNIKNNQNKAVNINLKSNSMKKDALYFGVTNECYAKWLKQTVKGSEKNPDLVSNLMFEIQKPTPEKKQALSEAMKNVDDWYKGVLEKVATRWGIQK